MSLPDVEGAAILWIADRERPGPFEDAASLLRQEAISALRRAVVAEDKRNGAAPTNFDPTERAIAPDAVPLHDPKEIAPLLKTLCAAPVAIIDLSAGPFAYYLLGLREAWASGATLACLAGEAPDWPAAGAYRRFLDISPTRPHDAIRKDAKKLLEPADDPRIRTFASVIREARVVSGRVDEKPLASPFPGDRHGDPAQDVKPRWRIRPGPDGRAPAARLGVVTGAIDKVSGVDVWVNSENTLMQMARVWDRSVSAQIRRLGARPTGGLGDERSYVDALGIDLARAMGARGELAIGDVVITRAPPRTQLNRRTQSNARGDVVPGAGVHLIAHVASVVPRTDGSGGFEAGGDIGRCVKNVFSDVAAFAAGRRKAEQPKTILFPLMGAGDGGANVELVAAQLVANIVDYIRKAGDAFAFEGVYLLAYKPRDKAACDAALLANGCEPDPERS